MKSISSNNLIEASNSELINQQTDSDTITMLPKNMAKDVSNETTTRDNIQQNDDSEEEEEDTGGHDTITSLAGANMMRGIKGRKQFQLSNSYGGSVHSNTSSYLEDMFKEEPILEEEDRNKETDADPPEVVEEVKEEIFVPPDGGYGWFICLGTFISMFWSAGLVKSYGVLFVEIIQRYPNDMTLVSWIPATMTTICLAMAPVTSILCQKYNTRLITAIGGAVTSTGIILSAFMTTLETTFVTLGVVTGFGLGMCTTPGVILTARYFNKRRSIANGICLSGTGAGSFIIPILMGSLLERYGYSGTLLILGGCTLHILISASLFRPLAVYVRIKSAQDRKKRIDIEKKLMKEKNETSLLNANVIEKDKTMVLKIDEIKDNKANLMDEDEIEEDAGVHDTITEMAGRKLLGKYRMRINERKQIDDCRNLFQKENQLRPNQEEEGNDNHSMERFTKDKLYDEYKEKEAMDNSMSIYSSSLPPDTSILSPLTPNLGKMSSNFKSSFDSICSEVSNPNQTSATNLANASQNSKRNSNITMQIHPSPNLKRNVHSSLSLSILGKKNQGPSRISLVSGHNFNADTDIVKMKRNWSSIMFSCEDLGVDSTSILKDTRHPSHVHLPGGEIHRQVSQLSGKFSSTKSLHIAPVKGVAPRSTINRSVSTKSEGTKTRFEPKIRKRFHSESESGQTQLLRSNSTGNRPSINNRRPYLSHRSTYHSQNSMDSRCFNSEDQLSLVGSSEMLAADPKETQKGKFTIAPVDTSLEKDNNKDIKEDIKESKKLCAKLNINLNKYIDLSLCKHPIFLLVGSSVMTMASGVPHCLYFLPPYVTKLGFNKADSGYLLSICAVFDVLGRILPAILLDRNWVPKYMVYVFNMFIAGMACLILPSLSSYSSLAICMSFYGFGIGGWFLMVPVLLADYLGVEKISSSYGLARLFQAVGNFCSPMISGYIMATSGVEYSFYFMGSIMTFGALLFLSQPFIAKRLE